MHLNNKTKSNHDKVTTPKGGGALSGLGESYQAANFNGAGSYHIPIPFPSARGMAPSIGLSYSSGGGNSSFGMGFNTGLPSISIKTSKGLPTYTSKDVFLLNGSELTPEVDNNGIPISTNVTDGDGIDWIVTTFKTRIAGGFSKIEKYTNSATLVAYWKIRSKNNELSIYGQDVSATLVDPNNVTHIFQWFLQEQLSPNGNRICYHYKSEDYAGTSVNPTDPNRPVNTYLDYVEYGNYFRASNELFAYKAKFIYQEFDPTFPKDINTDNWTLRADPFSSFKSGFEIRNFRLCQGVAVYHQFDGEFNGDPVLSKVLSLFYNCNQTNISQYSGLSFLEKATVYSYRLDGTDVSSDNYDYKWLPPVLLEYQNCEPNKGRFQKLRFEGDIELPGYLWNGTFTALDLYSEGLPGFLLSNDESTLYWEPLGNGKYGEPTYPNQFPANKNTQSREVVITDLDGGGYKSLVTHEHQITGFYESNEQGAWDPYMPFAQNATELSNPQTLHLDLNGNGLADILIFEDTYLRWYPSLGQKGFGAAQNVSFPSDFPAVENTSKETYIGFHGMNGDGLSDRVKIENGQVTYWANKGYGCFAEAKIMDNAPQFPGNLNTRYLHFADIDGSGTTDIIYLQHDAATIWFNQAGNQFSAPLVIPLPENLPFDSISKVNFADILGNGTNCMVLTRIEPTVEHWYFDIAGQHKPYMLKSINNNCGAITNIKYTTSVKEYLKDKRKGRTCATQLFFPVQVVEQTETLDEISGAFHLVRHAYHDGYFDPYERVFRGFGFVESWDTMHYKEFEAASSSSNIPIQTVNAPLHVPPTYTKIWFHTGAYKKADVIEATYQEEYFDGDALAQSIPSNSFADATGDVNNANWEPHTYRQAYAALHGQMLRQEVYGLDDSGLKDIPFTVSESSVQVRLLQERYDQRYAVLFPVVIESISWHYERNPADPKISHSFNLDIDEYGNHGQSCAVHYPRRNQSAEIPVFPEQQILQVVASQTDFANKIETDCRWTGVAYQSKSYQIKPLDSFDQQWTYADAQVYLAAALANVIDNDIDFNADDTPQARLLSHSKTYFWNEDQSNPGNLGDLTSLNLHHHSETALGTGAFYNSVYADKDDIDGKMTEGGLIYDQAEDYWWNYSPISYFHSEPENFYLPEKTANDWVGKNDSLVIRHDVFYDPYNLFHIRGRVYYSDTEYLETSGLIDYQALQVWQATGVNGNISEVLFDAFGMVVVSTHYGTTMGETEGNAPISDYTLRTDANFDDVLANPELYLQNASTYIYYDHLAWMNEQQPACATSLIGEKYQSQIDGDENNIQISVAYSDGLGRVIETKHKTDAGPVNLIEEDGILQNPEGTDGDPTWSNERWVVSGRTIYNNKGKAAQQYLSYYSRTASYEKQAEIDMENLVPPPSTIHYDALGRGVRTDTSKGFYSKVEFTPWLVKHYDANDTVLDSSFYENNNGNLSDDEQDALTKALNCEDTPAIQIMDNLGRGIRSIKDNLGTLNDDSFDSICAGTSTTSTDVYSTLISLGILTDNGNDTAALSERTLSWDSNLIAELSENFEEISDDLTAFLYQGRITTEMVYNIQGYLIQSTDSRLFYNNLISGTADYNFLHTYNMPGHSLYSYSCDAGESWVLTDQFGKVTYSWDARRFMHQQSYDQLQRPLQTTVTGGDLNLDNIVSVVVYGESLADAADRNINGKAYQVYDEAGVLCSESYTIDGHPLTTQRHLRIDYKTEANWNAIARDAVLQNEVFETEQKMDAIGKLLEETLPDQSKLLPSYDVMGNIKKLEVQLSGSSNPETIVQNIEYDVDNAPTQVSYGNGVEARMTYEATTKRLLRYTTYRTTGGQETLQDISYAYDPVGNITRKVDSSSDVIFHSNQQVLPLSDYTYDLIYRLIAATGRQMKNIGTPQVDQYWVGENGIPNAVATPNDLKQLEMYQEYYNYDTENNLLGLQHVATTSWSRSFEMSATSNRLADKRYDAHGNMQALDHLRNILWDYRDNISSVDIIERADQANDCEYYVYDGSGHRIRKVTERLVDGGNVEITDKIYLGNYQRTQTYAKIGGADPVLTMEKQSIEVGTGSKKVCLIQQVNLDVTNSGGIEIGQAKYRYQLMDGDHSVSMEVNELAEIITYEEYFPYGITAFAYGKTATDVQLKEYRYSGEERDKTGMYYYGARYYPPWLYRWLKPDPAGTVDGLNLYAFVSGSPVTHVDVGGFAKAKWKSDIDPKNIIQKNDRFSKSEARKKITKTEHKNSRGHKGRSTPAGKKATSEINMENIKKLKAGRYFQKDKIRVHFKGSLDVHGETSGIEPFLTKSMNRSWTPEHKELRNNLGDTLVKHQGFTPRSNGSKTFGAENSHIIAGSWHGPNDNVSAPPASVHQNTEVLAIETAVKNLKKKGLNPIVKGTAYLFSKKTKRGGVSYDAGVMVASRHKIYIGGKKVFDHLASGLRGNIDVNESEDLYNTVKGLSASSPTVSLFNKKKTKGLGSSAPPDLAAVSSGSLNSANSPLFTDIRLPDGTRKTGQNAKQHITNLSN